MITRRMFLKAGAAAGVGLLVPWKLSEGVSFAAPRYASKSEAIPGGTLDPTNITKYITQLVIPPAMPKSNHSPGGKRVRPLDYYEIIVKQFQQQILPPGLPPTTVWSYGAVGQPTTFNYPAFTIEAAANRPVRVKWVNGLVDRNQKYLPHLLPVDQTLHWANPAGGATGRDTRPTFTETPGPYRGPVPIVTHVHGAHVSQESDGNTEAWFLPNAADIPVGYAKKGSKYKHFKDMFFSKWQDPWTPGSATFQYPNDQRATTCWYHDHTLGMTRLNVYAGPAGFFLIRGGESDLPKGVLPGPAPGVGANPFGTFYEIPIAIQDRSLNADGSLFFPDSRQFFDGFGGPYIPETDVSPIWNPEFFGNIMVVNGRTWPFLNVEKRRYRFRLLNGCNARTVILKIVGDPEAGRPATAALPFWVVGTEGGFLPEPVQLDSILQGPAERFDVLVDFTDVPEGTDLYLINEGPDQPFNGGEQDPADPATTGQVMKFHVVAATGQDNSTRPDQLQLPAFVPVGTPTNTRQVSLNELTSSIPGTDMPIAAMLGTMMEDGMPMPMMWSDPITENPALNSTEVWEIYNFTMDAHPIHIHEVMFQVVNRENMDMGMPTGELEEPEEWETGYKDTVLSYPDQITRVKAKFDLPGLYVWHCHIVDHEDNEMMRPYYVGPM